MGMNDWKSKLQADPVPWLLGADNPSVRYLTLVDILARPTGSGEALEAKKAIMTQGLVPRILARMQPEGYWETAERFYTAKYKGTAWQFIVLAELSLIIAGVPPAGAPVLSVPAPGPGTK